MTLRHIKIFLKVYETQNITKAAELLNMTQPAVTRAVKEMESYYGVRLFDRINKHLVNNPCGTELYNKALHIQDTFAQMESSLTDWDNKGIIRIGSTITIGNFIVPGLAKSLKNQYPDIKLKVTISNQKSIEKKLSNGDIDIALLESLPSDNNFRKEQFASDKLVLIMSEDCELLSNKQITLSDIVRYPLLMREKGSAGRSFVQKTFETHSVPFETTWESVSTQALVKAVHNNLGVSVLPEELVRSDIESGYIKTKTVSDADFSRAFWICYHKNKYLSDSMKQIIKELKQKQYSYTGKEE